MTGSDFAEIFFRNESPRPGTYGDYERDGYREGLDRIAEAILDRFSPRSVLDIGCASGYLVEGRRSRGIEAWGTDVSDFALGTASPEVSPFLRHADLNNDRLPFADSAFDLIACLGVLEYVVPHELVLNEIARVASPDCVVILHSCTRAASAEDLRRNALFHHDWRDLFKGYGFDVDPDASRDFWRRYRHDQLTVQHELGRGSELAFVHSKGGLLGRRVAERYLARRARVTCDLVFRKAS